MENTFLRLKQICDNITESDRIKIEKVYSDIEESSKILKRKIKEDTKVLMVLMEEEDGIMLNKIQLLKNKVQRQREANNEALEKFITKNPNHIFTIPKFNFPE